jgi:hypothetical protein
MSDSENEEFNPEEKETPLVIRAAPVENRPLVTQVRRLPLGTTPVRGTTVRNTPIRGTSPERATLSRGATLRRISPNRGTTRGASLRRTSPVRGGSSQRTSPERVVRRTSPTRTVSSPTRTIPSLREETKIAPPIVEEKLNLNTLPPDVLQHIAEFSGINDIRTLVQTFSAAGVIRGIPLPLGSLEMTMDDTFRYFSNPGWNVTELKIVIEKNKSEFKLPEHMYAKLNKLELIGPIDVFTNLGNLYYCTSLKSFALRITSGGTSNGPKLDLLSKKITSLSIEDDKSTISVTDIIPTFPLLQHLSLRNNLISRIDFLKSTPRLLSLNLSGNILLVNIRGLEYCPNLTSLNLIDCIKLTRPEGWHFVPKLKELHLDLTTIQPDFHPDLNLYSQLETLDITNVRTLDWMPMMKKLTKLDLSKLNSLRGIDKFPNLTDLLLSGSFDNLVGLEECKNIQSLGLLNCPNLDDIWAIKDYTKLTNLEILNCPLIDDIPSFITLTNLTILGENKVDDYSFLAECRKLTHLAVRLKTTRAYIFYSSIANLEFLEVLSIAGGRDVEFPNLPNLSKLKHLTLYNFGFLRYLTYLKNFPSLQSLYLKGAISITDFASIGQLPNLEELRIEDCAALESLHGLQPCINLRTLIISNCQTLSNTHPLLQIRNRLTKVRISGTLLFLEGFNNQFMRNLSSQFPGWRVKRSTPDEVLGKNTLVVYGL